VYQFIFLHGWLPPGYQFLNSLVTNLNYLQLLCVTKEVKLGVDIFHCSQRRFWEPEFEGSDLNLAGWAKKITGQPTITVGSIGLSGDMTSAFQGQDSDVRDLDELLRRFDRGDFDLVAVGRALLGDYQWVEKIKNSRVADLKKFEAKSLAVLY
jgi:2,4-dienoyl-CoA reductase-like NADH-dependent reductase (Old Yellow Enzyme family)